MPKVLSPSICFVWHQTFHTFLIKNIASPGCAPCLSFSRWRLHNQPSSLPPLTVTCNANLDHNKHRCATSLIATSYQEHPRQLQPVTTHLPTQGPKDRH